MGTPRYMAPEQVTGEAVDARSDLFAAGAILFEMLAGRPAFGGRTVVEVLHATRYEQPPALTGSPAVAAVDRVIRRALAKRPADRPASADAMAEELRAVRGVERRTTRRRWRSALTRLVVLPFRVLRPDPETDFLAFSLPDAIATSLSGIGSLVVRSSAVAARFARRHAGSQGARGGGRRRPRRHGHAAAVRRSAARRGAARRGAERHAAHVAHRPVVAGRSVPAAGRHRPARRRSAVAAADRRDAAPTAGRAARCARLRALSARERARADLRRPQQRARLCTSSASSSIRASRRRGPSSDAAIASSASTSRPRPTARPAPRRRFAARSRSTRASRSRTSSTPTSRRTSARRNGAVVRLLGEADRHGNDPELFAGLVHACRYCGLFEQSIAAHAEARRLDPNVPTSLEQTLLMAGRHRSAARSRAAGDSGGRRRWDPGDRSRACRVGCDEARRKLLDMRQRVAYSRCSSRGSTICWRGSSGVPPT